MTPADLSRLESLAREATPGEWKASTRRPFIVAVDHKMIAECFGPPPSGDIANAAYIASANPAAVLALIERVRELEAALRSVADEWRNPGPMGTVYGMDRSISYIESIIGRTEDAAS